MKKILALMITLSVPLHAIDTAEIKETKKSINGYSDSAVLWGLGTSLCLIITGISFYQRQALKRLITSPHVVCFKSLDDVPQNARSQKGIEVKFKDPKTQQIYYLQSYVDERIYKYKEDIIAWGAASAAFACITGIFIGASCYLQHKLDQKIKETNQTQNA